MNDYQHKLRAAAQAGKSISQGMITLALADAASDAGANAARLREWATKKIEKAKVAEAHGNKAARTERRTLEAVLAILDGKEQP